MYFCLKFNDFMKFPTPYIGIFLIILGTLALTATRLSALSSHNSLLLLGLVLIILGIVLHIRSIKKDSLY